MALGFSIPESDISSQVAALLNQNNRLGQTRRGEDILYSPVNYLLEVRGSIVVGVCGLDRQSYTFTEIKHLVIRPNFRKQGIAKFLVKRALLKADTPIIFASVRADNQSSLSLFEGLGFQPSVDYKSNDHQVKILTRINEQWPKKSSGQPYAPVRDLIKGGPNLPSE